MNIRRKFLLSALSLCLFKRSPLAVAEARPDCSQHSSLPRCSADKERLAAEYVIPSIVLYEDFRIAHERMTLSGFRVYRALLPVFDPREAG